mmetsp:Transcript_818/g.1830  ORF Transcript_818/g.1830 Transcript_818/m.1830 type:complete len:682 (-) Transcript_818:95-2140(-)
MPDPQAPAVEETTVGVHITKGTPLPDMAPVLVSMLPATGSERTPSDICCVVDVSGSMGAEAMLKGEDGEMTGHGLSVLDIVKHALKTIVRNLSPYDRLALVQYSDSAKRVFDLTEMNDEGKQSSERQLEMLQPAGMTNLWDGLKTGVDVVKSGYAPNRLSHVMLFTDGLPNYNPPRGILPMLKRLKDKEGGKLPCTINTFGFGYELDSELLSEIAISGSGGYAFIPDAGFVGTVFVNSMSNLLVTMAKDAVVTLKPLGGASFCTDSPVLGGYPFKKEGEALTINLGCLQFGQSKDLVVYMKGGQLLQAELEYTSRAGTTMKAVGTEGAASADSCAAVEKQFCRLLAVDAMRQAMKTMKLNPADAAAKKELALTSAQALVSDTIAKIEGSSVASDPAIEALLEDLQGQVSEALSREDWYSRWGVHYLPSLLFAHLVQQCNNFKDAGVQVYGGDLFSDIRDQADDVFCSLPPPTPSARPPPAPASRPSVAASIPAPVVNMSTFHDRYGGCIDGATLVRMADGRLQGLATLNKGDAVVTLGGRAAEVQCVVRTPAPHGKFSLVEVNGGSLQITSHHPIQIDGAWRFPAELAAPEEKPCEAVYTLVLEEGASAIVAGGLLCATLGHGLTEGSAWHPFFASRERVLRDLARFSGFENGFVELQAECIVRDSETGLVCGFVPPPRMS